MRINQAINEADDELQQRVSAILEKQDMIEFESANTTTKEEDGE